MTEKQLNRIKAGMGIVFVAAMLILSDRAAEYVTTGSSSTQSGTDAKAEPENKGTGKDRLVVVIDAGHGGIDPGKVGINHALEKDINLAIAKKVKHYLELSDVEVIMTREEDRGLYQETDSNKKVQDMKNRVALIDDSGADLAVSIHQNAYQQENVSGAQVFYYTTSPEGKEIAEIMQSTIEELLDSKKKRPVKANDSYYVLKKTKTPIIIAECGFLSNRAEAELLTQENYQDRVAWAIHMGILRYANKMRMI